MYYFVYLCLTAAESRAKVWPEHLFKGPSQWLRLLSVLSRGSVLGGSLFFVAPDVCGGYLFGSCFVMRYSFYLFKYSKTCLKRPLKKKTKH